MTYLTSLVCPTPCWYDFCLNSQSGHTVVAYGNAPSAHDERGRDPGLLHLVWPLVSEQGPAPAPATGGGRMAQRPTRCVASRAQAASRWPPTSHVEREAACCSHNERSVS